MKEFVLLAGFSSEEGCTLKEYSPKSRVNVMVEYVLLLDPA